MKKITTLLLLAFLIQTSCDFIKDDCGECFTPPPTFIFEFVDKDNGENLFTNKTFDIDDVNVTDEDGKSHEFELITEDNMSILNLGTLGWDLEPNLYTIKLSDKTSVKFDLDIDGKHGECCAYYQVKNFKVYNYEYERSNNSGFIIIKI